jgi:hypothetical protein
MMNNLKLLEAFATVGGGAPKPVDEPPKPPKKKRGTEKK